MIVELPKRPEATLVVELRGRAEMNKRSAAAHLAKGDLLAAARCLGRVEAYENVIASGKLRVVPTSGRPAVDRSLERFLPHVVDKLFENTHKGDSWATMPLDGLFTRLRGEVGELQTEALTAFAPCDTDAHAVRVAREAADVVAFALFIAAKVGGWWRGNDR